MPKDQRSSVAVSRETAAALKAVADEVGATVGELLHFAALKPAILQRAYLQGDRAVKAARLTEIGQRRMASAAGSGSSTSPAPGSGSRSASASPAPAAGSPSAPVASSPRSGSSGE